MRIMYTHRLYVTEMLTNISWCEKRNPIVKKLSLKDTQVT